MHRHAWRLSLRVTMILALLITLTAPSASANKPIRGSDTHVSIECWDPLESPAGTAVAGAGISETWGAFGYVEFWATGQEPFSWPPTLRLDWESEHTGSWDGSSFLVSVPLVDADGNPAGLGVFDATLTPAGDPVAIDEDFRWGNTRHRSSGTFQPMAVSGTLTLPGGIAFLLDGCLGGSAELTFFETVPSAFSVRYTTSGTNCRLDDGAGQTGGLHANPFEDGMAFVGAWANEAELDAFGIAEMAGNTLVATLDVFDFGSGIPLEDRATLDATISSTGERFTYTVRNATGFRTISGEFYTMSGTLSFPGGPTFDLADCLWTDAIAKEVWTQRKGPKPGGKPPANDTPDGATLMKVGQRLAQQTKSASFEMEEPYECLVFSFEDEEWVVPVMNTVWFRIEGTGGPITVDTKGSIFDTVAAVYTSDGAGGYAPVDEACVDDVPLTVGWTLQAAVSWESVAGTTYYVQIGGYPDGPNYGSLHVRVR